MHSDFCHRKSILFSTNLFVENRNDRTKNRLARLKVLTMHSDFLSIKRAYMSSVCKKGEDFSEQKIRSAL
jgi:hypothetical protein